jgi:hypothetical protein
MKRHALALAAAILLWLPSSAAAQVIDCGEITNHNDSYQYGDFNWLEYIVETRRPMNICPFVVAVEAWVVGHPGGSASSAWDLFTAVVRRSVLLPRYGRWQTNGKHWRILSGFWYSNGATASFADVRERRPDPAQVCAALGWEYYWNGWECVYTPGSPIIVDTARNGYKLTGVAGGVLFDMNGDGTPERTAWTRRDSDDAFLAMDRNGNGRIDDGSELFGNYSPAFADGGAGSALNGFEALKFTQGPGYGPSVVDHQVDARDAVFSELLLWRDVNHNGISEPEELTPADRAGVRSIGTEYREKKRVDKYGNEFRQKGRITWADGKTDAVFDIWLKRDQ